MIDGNGLDVPGEGIVFHDRIVTLHERNVGGKILLYLKEEMFTHGYFAWTGRFSLADYIAGNTCNHYAWAKRQILKWVDLNHQKARSRNG